MNRARLFFAAALCLVISCLSSNLTFGYRSDRDVADITPEKGKASTLVELQVEPSEIRLNSKRSIQNLLVTAIYSDNSTQDVTAKAGIQVTPANLVEYDQERFFPVHDGQGKLTVQFGGKSLTVDVHVSQSQTNPPIEFRNEVMPTLTKSGCNSGKCHGSASGKDGFRLSLYGFDPDGDHFRLTRELSGRRISLMQPANSLLLLKATGNVAHTGGECFPTDSHSYDILLQWLSEGACKNSREVPQPIGIDVLPHLSVFEKPDGQQKMIVMAKFDDGSTRDVTATSNFFSNNDSVVSVNEHGLLSANGPGAAFVMARFDQFTEGTSIVVRPGTPFELESESTNNQIDELVDRRMKFLHVQPSELCTDEQFLRRATLDLTGLPPTVEEYQSFRQNPSPNKRSEWIETLLQRDEFDDIWVMRWAELLQIRTNNGVSTKGLKLYDQWLREAVHRGQTIDQIVKHVLPSSGGTLDNPATNYYQTETTPQLIAENVAQVFLGTRIQCAQCHNHPFDRWTMDDYYGFAAFFSQVGYKQAQDPRELTIYNSDEGGIEHPIQGRKVEPRFLGSQMPAAKEGKDYREVVAEWLASHQNKAFRENIANIVWAHFFGVGIVEPYDDTRVSNPPSNPALLEYLGNQLGASRFDIKPLIREICNSRTYQRQTNRNASNKLDEREFSHQKIRRLRAEVLLDCISKVTNTTDRLPGLPEGARAVHVADGLAANYFLTTFGRSSRATPCSCEIKTSPTLSQALHLLNGESTNGKIREGNLVGSQLAEGNAPLDVAKYLYRRCLSRECTDQETSKIATMLDEYPDAKESLEDLFWAILNSNEFIFNH